MARVAIGCKLHRLRVAWRDGRTAGWIDSEGSKVINPADGRWVEPAVRGGDDLGEFPLCRPVFALGGGTLEGGRSCPAELSGQRVCCRRVSG